jgi:hypothetical protein
MDRQEYETCKTEKEAIELILESEWFPWQQDEALDWFKQNRGWFKEEELRAEEEALAYQQDLQEAEEGKGECPEEIEWDPV